SYPRVLLTHIPLYRRDWTYCGPNRKTPVINQVLILSGHDHDQCTITHKSTSGPVMEVCIHFICLQHTVGTVSWQEGNMYPSFMLLSATNVVLSNTSSPDEEISTQLYFLQAIVYLSYTNCSFR
ncbi:uncharacterized protein LOC133797934, partial [Humulus lupulus]|uniref:uncharacterized protein LOC133797934 n=1 Tax=Humulus lupulus TaxID=3486 RepID=UPI002B40A158